jgi:hypothetical protein
MTSDASVPPKIKRLISQIVKEYKAGNSEPSGLKDLYDWLEVDGWDVLVTDPDEKYAIKLAYIAYSDFSDDEVRHNLDIPENVAVQDSDRIAWGRSRIDYAVSQADGYLIPSLNTYTLKGKDGYCVYVGCMIEIHGQAGPVCEWCGLWRSKEEFFASATKDNAFWITELSGDVPDEVILSLWKDRHPAKGPKAARKSTKKN